MFPMHERTRRMLCRWVFVVLGLVPTATLVAWSASVSSPAYRGAIVSRLQSALGLAASVDTVSHPRPGVILLEGVHLTDPESGETVARIGIAECGAEGNAQVSDLSQVDIHADNLRRLFAALEHRLQAGHIGSLPSVRITARAATVHWSGTVQTFVDCTAELGSSGEGNVAALSFRDPGADSADGTSIQIERATRSGRPSTSVELSTGAKGLPVSLMAAVISIENCLGARSSFQGTLSLAEMPDGWNAGASGRVREVDLRRAIGEQFPHQLSGAAEVSIEKAVVHDSRLEQFSGDIHAGPGLVSESLLAAAARFLNLQAPFGGQASSDTVAYSELALRAKLDASGLVLKGCVGGESGVVMRSDSAVLLRSTDSVAIPVVALVRALVPDSRLQVPATRQSDWLLGVLPVPDAAPFDADVAPQARLRGFKSMK